MGFFHQSIGGNVHFLLFYFATLIDWFKILAPLSQPIRSKTETIRDSREYVFPRLASAKHGLTVSFAIK